MAGEACDDDAARRGIKRTQAVHLTVVRTDLETAAAAKDDDDDGRVVGNRASTSPSPSSEAGSELDVDVEAEAEAEAGAGGDADPDAPYHVFSTARKRQLTMLVSVGGLFPSLSNSIYLPALAAISEAMHVDIALLFLSSTVYLVVQSVASALWGPLSDARGRRVVFLVALLAFAASNAGLAVSTRYPELLIFRALQGAGGVAVLSVGVGVVADYTESSERGAHLGVLSGVRIVAQSVGPVLGGLLEQTYGWGSIAYVLLVLGLISLVLVLVFLPETHRATAGDGSVPLRGLLDRPLIYAVTGQPHVASSSSTTSKTSPRRPRRPAAAPSLPMLGLLEKDVLATLFLAAAVNAVWTAVTCTTDVLLQPRFGLTDLQAGLCFLPGGAGGALGSWLAGRALSCRPSPHEAAMPTTTHSRLRHAPVAVALLSASVAAYGWAAHPALGPLPLSLTSPPLPPPAVLGPLALQFLASVPVGAISTQTATLATDLYPQGAGASAAAAVVLVRGLASAAAAAGVPYALEVQLPGFVFVEFAGVVALVSGGMLWILRVWGAEWRWDRERRRHKELWFGS